MIIRRCDRPGCDQEEELPNDTDQMDDRSAFIIVAALEPNHLARARLYFCSWLCLKFYITQQQPSEFTEAMLKNIPPSGRRPNCR